MSGGESAPRFGELLKVRRERVGLTQQCLADHATLSVRAIRDMETGRVQRPRQETVRLLADALRLEGRARSVFEAAARQREPVDEPTAPPPARSAIVGRATESDVLFDALTLHGDRLVTVVGLAGVGKTRLVLEVAERVHRSEQWSVRWTRGGRLDGLLEAIDERPTLLVIDGADRGVDPVLLDELFHRCAGLRVVITSRLPLGLDGEQTVPLAPLETPEPGQDGDLRALGEVGAVRLFVSHLRRLRPGFRLEPADAGAVACLCRYLDGLPGALELAAGWALVQSPAQLVERIAASPFSLPAPPVIHQERGDVREPLCDALRALTTSQRTLLGLLADEPGDWSADEAVALSGLAPQECLGLVHQLLSRGMIRPMRPRAGLRFTVLNLFRVLCREESRRWTAAPFPLLEVLAG